MEQPYAAPWVLRSPRSHPYAPGLGLVRAQLLRRGDGGAPGDGGRAHGQLFSYREPTRPRQWRTTLAGLTARPHRFSDAAEWRCVRCSSAGASRTPCARIHLQRQGPRTGGGSVSHLASQRQDDPQVGADSVHRPPRWNRLCYTVSASRNVGTAPLPTECRFPACCSARCHSCWNGLAVPHQARPPSLGQKRLALLSPDALTTLSIVTSLSLPPAASLELSRLRYGTRSASVPSSRGSSLCIPYPTHKGFTLSIEPVKSVSSHS